MGYSSYSRHTYDAIKTKVSTLSTDKIFTNNASRTISADMSPKSLRLRECRDSATHPTSLAIQFWLDVTGSMGSIPANLVKNKLSALIETIQKHGIASPAVLFGGIGDQRADKAPLQIGQFESGTEELVKWLTSLFLEGGGGGQNMESYLLAWYVAGKHTSIDCFEKRGKKGYLFTVGDEKTWPSLNPTELQDIFGVGGEKELTAENLLAAAQQMYHVFHIHINSTGNADDPEIIGDWKRLLGERLIILNDPDVIAETVASTIAVMEGSDKASVLSGFDSTTAKSISSAIVNVSTDRSLTSSKVIQF